MSASYKSIEPAALQALLAKEPPPPLLDVRTAEEFSRGHLAGAHHIPLQELTGRVEAIRVARPLVVYCLSGARSGLACQFLAQQGFDELYNLAGGCMAWSRLGLPIVG